MKKPTLLLIRYGAFGDWLYTIPILPQLFKKYEVVLECSVKVGMLVYNDPRFKAIDCFYWEKEVQKKKLNDRLDTIKACGPIFDKREKYLIDKYKPDKIINLNSSIETQCITESFQKEFYWPIDKRREVYLRDSFYDSIFRAAKLDKPTPLQLDCLYYSSKELNWAKQWRKKHKDKFIIMLAIAGSTFPKIFHNYYDYIQLVLQEYPDVIFYITGDEKTSQLVPKHPRIKNACNNASFKQLVLMAKFSDYVIGPETGIVVAAGIWGTPKTMMCTMSSVDQCTRYQQNDYSIQSPIYCSPCIRAIYAEQDCYEVKINPNNKLKYAACSKQFKVETLISILKKVRQHYGEGKLVPHLANEYLPS